MSKRLMTEDQYAALHDELGVMSSPWDNPGLFGQPGEAKAKWRRTVDRWLRALDKVLPYESEEGR